MARAVELDECVGQDFAIMPESPEWLQKLMGGLDVDASFDGHDPRCED